MSDFSRTLALLRREKKISQRAAAGDLGVSQALLSHYEERTARTRSVFCCACGGLLRRVLRLPARPFDGA